MIHQRNVDDTVAVRTVDWLRQHGLDWLRYPDTGILTNSSHLDAAGRARARAEAAVRCRVPVPTFDKLRRNAVAQLERERAFAELEAAAPRRQYRP